MQLPDLKYGQPFNILWMRRNLRLDDNRPLILASQSDLPILPLFIFDQDILSKLSSPDDLRVNFIHQQVSKINESLSKWGSGIMTLHGKPEKLYKAIMKNWKVKEIFYAEDFEPYAKTRDAAIKLLADKNGIKITSCIDHIMHHPADVLKGDGDPYRVYTPYSRKWIEELTPKKLAINNSTADAMNWVSHQTKSISLKELGFNFVDWQYPSKQFSSSVINQYGAKRNLPAENANSNLGVHLRFGTVSIRKLVHEAQKSADPTFLKQLIWREFFMQIMHHYPSSMNQAFKAKYRDMPWEFSEAHFEKWTLGQTGIPIVDAGMRELLQTGTMHNRVRMITASWLTKNLLHDWRLGERYFASKLLDFELASNVGSWQWVAGTGVDAAPYFRIFNPMTQAKKFDPNRSYIEKWVPEIDSLSYPPPMIDYKASREACLTFYKTYAK